MQTPYALLVSPADEDGNTAGWDDPGLLVERVLEPTDNDDVCVAGNEDRALVDFRWTWFHPGPVQARHAEALLVTVPDHVTDWTSWLDDLLSDIPEWRDAEFGTRVSQLDEDEGAALIADHNDAYIDYHRALAEEYGEEVRAEQARERERERAYEYDSRGTYPGF